MADAPAAASGFIGAGAERAAFRSWEPPAARGAVLIVHGLGDHGGRYAAFASHLAERGFAAYALDLRGHGRSPGQRGHVASFEVFLRQVQLLRLHVERRHPGTPLFILGQSMGGLVVTRYLQEFEPQPTGAVLCSPWLGTAMPVPAWKLRLAPLIRRLLPRLPFRHGLVAAHLTRDPERVQAYETDPLVHGRITPATFAAVTDAMRRAHEHAERLRCPLLVLLSGDDRVVSTATAARLFASLPADRVTMDILPGHFHELLQEPDRVATAQRIARWLEERL